MSFKKKIIDINDGLHLISIGIPFEFWRNHHRKMNGFPRPSLGLEDAPSPLHPIKFIICNLIWVFGELHLADIDHAITPVYE